MHGQEHNPLTRLYHSHHTAGHTPRITLRCGAGPLSYLHKALVLFLVPFLGLLLLLGLRGLALLEVAEVVHLHLLGRARTHDDRDVRERPAELLDPLHRSIVTESTTHGGGGGGGGARRKGGDTFRT